MPTGDSRVPDRIFSHVTPFFYLQTTS